jgi:hypothetical protein
VPAPPSADGRASVTKARSSDDDGQVLQHGDKEGQRKRLWILSAATTDCGQSDYTGSWNIVGSNVPDGVDKGIVGSGYIPTTEQRMQMTIDIDRLTEAELVDLNPSFRIRPRKWVFGPDPI